MPYVVSAIVFVGLISLLDLLLITGIVRRLRRHEELLSRTKATSGNSNRLPVGAPVEAFEVRTRAGKKVVSENLSDRFLVTFLDPDCPPCKREVPRFADYARDFPGGRENTLAVVLGDPERAADSISLLDPVAHVVVGDQADRLQQAFNVEAFPVVCEIVREDGVLRVADTEYRYALVKRPAGVS